MTWADRLEALPTITQGQTSDLKYDADGVRVWLHRTGLADGEPFARTVTVETLDRNDGRWSQWDVLDGDDPRSERVFTPLHFFTMLRRTGAVGGA